MSFNPFIGGGASEDKVARAEIAAIKDGETLDSFSDVEAALSDKVDKKTGKGLSTNDYTTAEKEKLAGIAEGAEVNEIQGIKVNSSTVNPDANKVVNITVPTSAADVSALPDTTKYAAALSLTINSSTFVMTGQLKDQNGDNLGTAQTIDLPLESVVVGGSYNSQTKKVVLTLQNGNTIEFSVADLVSGLQTELSTSNKLNPAFIDYDSTHRAVSDAEKTTWNGKQNALSSTQLSAVNSGITSADVEQITTNKNNISYLENTGKKNWLKPVPISGVPTGITVQYESDDSITIDGTYSGSEYAYVNLHFFVHEAMQYTFSCNVATSSSTFYFFTYDNKMTTNLTPTYTYTENGTTRVVMRIAPNTSFDNVNVKLMIRPSIITDTTYQPYAMSNAELTAKEQVNENNISFAVEKIGNNLVNVPSGSGVRWIDVPVNIPPGVYTLGFSNLSGNDSRQSQVSFYSGDYSFYTYIDKGNDVYINNVTFTNTVTSIRIYASTNSTTSLNQGVNFTTLFLCKQETWNSSVGIQSYAMSNAELTQTIGDINTVLEEVL